MCWSERGQNSYVSFGGLIDVDWFHFLCSHFVIFISIFFLFFFFFVFFFFAFYCSLFSLLIIVLAMCVCKVCLCVCISVLFSLLLFSFSILFCFDFRLFFLGAVAHSLLQNDFRLSFFHSFSVTTIQTQRWLLIDWILLLSVIVSGLDACDLIHTHA